MKITRFLTRTKYGDGFYVTTKSNPKKGGGVVFCASGVFAFTRRFIKNPSQYKTLKVSISTTEPNTLSHAIYFDVKKSSYEWDKSRLYWGTNPSCRNLFVRNYDSIMKEVRASKEPKKMFISVVGQN